MRDFFYKKWVKVCAVILCIVSFNAAVFSLSVMVFSESSDISGKTKEEILEEMSESICDEYSKQAVIRYKDDFGMEQLKNTNFRYGVIQTNSLEGLDLNDKSIYETCNFDRNVTEDMLYIHSYNMGNSTSFYAGNSLFDRSYVYNEKTYVERKSMIQDYYYARDVRLFYCRTENNEFYPVYPNEVPGPVEELLGVMENEEGEEEYVWSVQDIICFQDQDWNLSDVLIVRQKDLHELGTVVSEDVDDFNFREYSVYNGYVICTDYEYGDTKPYYVLSYVNDPLQDRDGFFGKTIYEKTKLWDRQDYFVQGSFAITVILNFRYGAFAGLLVSAILFLLSFAALMTGAGHRNKKEVEAGFLDRIPLDLFAVLIYLILFGCVMVEAGCFYYMGFMASLWFGGILLLFAECLCILACMSLSARLKIGGIFKNTLCWRLWNRFAGFVKRNLQKVGSAVPLLWKAWLVMGGLAFLELIGLSATAYHPGMQVALWFLEKVFLYAAITIALLQMRKLQQAGERLAKGELNSHLDTTGMFWDFKQHGDNLNNIREGINRAVAEQLKSERFRTELITNVSHDIKTPLTSIINYVDLLEKEDIDNANANEYLEVLSRQSKRLKKLIEDLMEASKASTGNLAVVFESCDAHVMLTQTIGEFEEKLKANQIELIVKGSDEPILIEADPRHLWRIFENLMNNICKYAQPSTRAYVNIEKQESLCRIIFRNISKYELNIGSDELMERFVRGDSSRNTEGSGLGLSIANSLTELMNGTFELVVDGDLFKVIVTFGLSKDPFKEK